MLKTNKQTKSHTQEGIVVWDQQGMVIAWPDGLARRFSWDLLRQLSMNKEMSGQSAQQESALVQRAA
jgi:DUF971 family protein